MNRILSLMGCCIMFSSVGVQAQLLPKYIYSTYVTGNPASVDFHSQGAPKVQWIYRPSELLGLPAGPVRSVYFRVGRVYGPETTPNPTIYDSMRLKMGYTPDTTYKDTFMLSLNYSLFKTGLTQVFFQPKFTIYGADSIGTWVRFPIDGFSYNTTANLVVELSRGHQGIRANGFDWMEIRDCYRCTIAGDYDKAYGSKPYGYQADIGFDDAPTVVGGLVNLKGFYAYPNPSEGLFTVGFEPWGSHASTVQVSVTDMAGRQVWQHSYQGVQARLFTANVDLRGQPKGVYLLRVQADAAQALQRVVLE